MANCCSSRAMGPRFAIRGVIYEFRAFLRPALADGSAAAAPQMEGIRGGDERSSSAVAAADAIPAMQVIAGMGIGAALPGVEQRVEPLSWPRAKEVSLDEDREAAQSLEEAIGSREAIRAKYAERLMRKKMAAEARREQQGRFGNDHGMFAVPRVRSSNDKFEAVDGSAKLVRYLQERGVRQALIAPNSASGDVASLDELLLNFRFDYSSKNSDDGLSDNVVTSLCSSWKLPPNQVMVVVSGDYSTDILNPAGILKCCVTSARDPTAASKENTEAINVETEEQRAGVFQWFRKKFEGFQRISPEPVPSRKKHFDAHYNVEDMTRLKWLFEEINGISYRPVLAGIN